jgi:hypothetical protein
LSEHAPRGGDGRWDMPSLTPTRLTGSTTDRLLDGVSGPEPLRQLLAAAAAPAQADELGGEQAARRAFTTTTGCRPLPAGAAHNWPKRTRALSWIVAAKAIAAVALTAGAGGVAVAATSGSFPAGPPDVSTHQERAPDSATARPAVVVDRASGTGQRPDTEPARERSPGSPDAARPDRTDSGGTPTTTVPAAHPDQPGRAETEAAPDDSTPAARHTVAPGNPQHATGPANGNKKKDNPGNSDHVADPRSDTAKHKQKAGQE